MNKHLDSQTPEAYIALATDLESDYLKTKHFLISRRKMLNITEKEVASFLGIPVSKVKAFEQYDYDPQISELNAYAMTLGVRINPSPEVNEQFKVNEQSMAIHFENEETTKPLQFEANAKHLYARIGSFE